MNEPAGGYDPALFRLLAELEPRSFWFRHRNRVIAWALARYFPQARSVLEIGCGTGYVLAGLRDARPELRVTGSELEADGLAVARERLPDAELLQLDARALPYRDAFDVVGAFDVLEHIPEDEDVLREMAGAGRGVLVTVPQHRWLWSAADDAAHHVRRYTRAELVGKAQRAGLRVEHVTSFVSVLLPAMALSRLRAAREYDLAAELVLPGPVDAVASRLLSAELALLRRGASLPAGGSLLMVATSSRS